MKRILRFLLQPYPTKKLLLESLSLMFLIRISLWIFPFGWLRKWLTRLEYRRVDHNEADWQVINEVVRAVRTSSRIVPRATCLTQALATRTLLRLRAQDPQLRIGVDKDAEDLLTAHAWIEIDGRIIVGMVPRHERYTVMNQSSATGL